MLKDLVWKNRSYRRYHESMALQTSILRELVDLARLAASVGNRQALRYIISNNPKTNAVIFPLLGWAGYLKDWPGPEEGERPAAYIIILGDTELAQSFGADHGIAAQTILLGAAEKGLGGCMIGSVNRRALVEKLSIPERYEVLLVLALGQPKEEVIIDPVDSDGDIKYWRDAEGRHHVPKRSLDSIILQTLE